MDALALSLVALRPVLWLLARLTYRFTVRHADRLPATGPALVVCNHVTRFDALLLAVASPRPLRFPATVERWASTW